MPRVAHSSFVSLGNGLTSTVIHEVGHQLGMSHPHDGYDYERDIDYVAEDEFYYVWAGDESNSVMNYLSLTTDFGQFDRDNMGRYMTANYINRANRVLAAIYASPRASPVSLDILDADSRAKTALEQYASMDYNLAAGTARTAFRKVLDAAARINVQVEPQAYQADYKAKGSSSKFVDGVGYPAKHMHVQ